MNLKRLQDATEEELVHWASQHEIKMQRLSEQTRLWLMKFIELAVVIERETVASIMDVTLALPIDRKRHFDVAIEKWSLQSKLIGTFVTAYLSARKTLVSHGLSECHALLVLEEMTNLFSERVKAQADGATVTTHAPSGLSKGGATNS